jgi:hypothetical protein
LASRRFEHELAGRDKNFRVPYKLVVHQIVETRIVGAALLAPCEAAELEVARRVLLAVFPAVAQLF